MNCRSSSPSIGARFGKACFECELVLKNGGSSMVKLFPVP